MTEKIGLLPVLQRMAAAALAASKSKKGEAETLRAITKALEPGANECVDIGMDQALIAVDDRKSAIRRARDTK